MNKNLEFKIYNGYGTSQEGIDHMIRNLGRFDNINVNLIGPLDFKDRNILLKCDLFMILGGRDIPYTQYLNGAPNLIIKDYVNNGGSFLGICAGAYYASSKIMFAENTNQEITGDRELKFYQGVCTGPTLTKYYYDSKCGARAARIGITNFLSQNLCNTYIHYNGGGAFIDAEKYKNVEILARYLDIENSPAAIIKTNFGKGQVILSGVHFEYCDAINTCYTQKKHANLISDFNYINSKFFSYIVNMLVGTNNE